MLTTPTAGSFFGLCFDGERSSTGKVNLHLVSRMAEKRVFWVKASFTEGFEIPWTFPPLYGTGGCLVFWEHNASASRTVVTAVVLPAPKDRGFFNNLCQKEQVAAKRRLKHNFCCSGQVQDR